MDPIFNPIYLVVPVLLPFVGALAFITLTFQGFKLAARKKSGLTSEAYKNASKTILSHIPNSFMTPIWPRIIASPEISIIWGTHFINITTGAINSLNPAELRFLLKSASALRKKQQLKHAWIIAIPMAIYMAVIMFTVLSAMQYFVPVFILALAAFVAAILPLNQWSLRASHEWYPDADASTLSSNFDPHSAISALAKMLESLRDKESLTYKTTLIRLNTIRGPEPISSPTSPPPGNI